MNYTGYCMLHDLCTVFVFESDYTDRAGIARNMGRAISDAFAYPGASFDFEAFPVGSPDGENIWELAEEAARDAVGQFAGCDSVPEYDLYGDIVTISKPEQDAARALASEYGAPGGMVRALLDALCAVHRANDISECRADASALLDSMTGYYN